jgi:hypothetical protein
MVEGKAVTKALRRVLIPLAGIVTLAGYFGPWVDHPVAGLVITGLDLGEYVKFLPSVRSGEVIVWRAGFYLPLVAVSLSQSLGAWRPCLGYPLPVRVGMLAVAVIAALNLLPPAWTPARMMTPEFYEQGGALVLCLAAVTLSPILALLPRFVLAFLLALLCGLAVWFPLRDFGRVLPWIAELYGQDLQPGWGMAVAAVGLVLLAAASLSLVWIGSISQSAPPASGQMQGRKP